jgi:ATP-dependent Clp protease protease subunit
MPELLIYEDIGTDFFGDGVSAKSVKEQLDSFTGDLSIRINSFGGDVFEGHTIYNLIKNYDGAKTVHIDGIAASAASVIAMAGDEIRMPVNAMLMIHNPYTLAMGDSAEMTRTAERLDQVKQTIVNVYTDKTGIDAGEVSEMMTAETWMDADQAFNLGFAVKSESAAVLNKAPVRAWINKAPDLKIDPVKEPEPVIKEQVKEQEKHSRIPQHDLGI